MARVLTFRTAVVWVGATLRGPARYVISSTERESERSLMERVVPRPSREGIQCVPGNTLSFQALLSVDWTGPLENSALALDDCSECHAVVGAGNQAAFDAE